MGFNEKSSDHSIKNSTKALALNDPNMSETDNFSDNMDPSHNFHDEMLEPNVIIKEDQTDEVLEPNVIIKEELNENDGGEWNDNQDYLDFYNAGSYPYYPADYTSQSYETPTEQNFTGIFFLIQWKN